MGYEEALAPLPTREQELDMIKRYADEFIAQPSYYFIQNMSRRKTDIEIMKEKNKIKKHYYLNLGIGLLVSSPIVYLLGGMFGRTASGVPYVYRPKNTYITPKFYNQDKRVRLILLQVSVWVLLGTYYANRYTNAPFLEDEQLENYRIHKML